MNYYKILIIEDEADLSHLIRAHLERSSLIHCEVIEEDRLKAGLGILERDGIDAVILDVRLPDDDGMESSIAEIRKISEKVAIYVLSGNIELKEAIRGIRLDADDCREKPPESFDRFAWTIALAIERRRHILREKENARSEFEAAWAAREAALQEIITTLSKPPRPWYKKRSVWVNVAAILGALAAIAKAFG